MNHSVAKKQIKKTSLAGKGVKWIFDWLKCYMWWYIVQIFYTSVDLTSLFRISNNEDLTNFNETDK